MKCIPPQSRTNELKVKLIWLRFQGHVRPHVPAPPPETFIYIHPTKHPHDSEKLPTFWGSFFTIQEDGFTGSIYGEPP